MWIIRVVAFVLVVSGLGTNDQLAGQTNDSPVLGVDIPQYPSIARQAGIQGRVELHVETGAEGKVVSATAISGHPLLSPSAIENAATWRFRPGRSERTIVYEYKIDGKAGSNDPYYKYGKTIFHLPSSVEVLAPPFIVEP